MRRDVVEKLGFPHLIYTAAFARHERRLPAGPDKGGVGVHRRGAPTVGMDLEMEVGRTPGSVAAVPVVTDDIAPPDSGYPSTR